jgi:hypothetical protein
VNYILADDNRANITISVAAFNAFLSMQAVAGITETAREAVLRLKAFNTEV